MNQLSDPRPELPEQRPTIATFSSAVTRQHLVMLTPATLGDTPDGRGWWVASGVPATIGQGDHHADHADAVQAFWDAVDDIALIPWCTLQSIRAGMPGSLRDLI